MVTKTIKMLEDLAEKYAKAYNQYEKEVRLGTCKEITQVYEEKMFDERSVFINMCMYELGFVLSSEYGYVKEI